MTEPTTTDRKIVNKTLLLLLQGDITSQHVDAIVNAANSSLLGGSGVDGAIHRKGGPAILEECRALLARIGRCNPGHAVVTTAGNLNAKHVIHTVGPVWQGGDHNESTILANCYRGSLEKAANAGDKTIAFPSISTGTYRYPVDLATHVALQTAAEFCRENGNIAEIRFVAFDEKTYAVFESELSKL